MAVHISQAPDSRCCAIDRATAVHYIVKAMTRTRWLGLGVLAATPLTLVAQDRLRMLPGYERAQRIAREGPVVRGGAREATWIDAGTLEYARDGRRYRYDVTARLEREIDAQPQSEGGSSRRTPPGEEPERGRQVAVAASPDGRLEARYRDRNVWVSAADGSGEYAGTTDRSATRRVKYGTASWAYGEELGQRSAMWW